MHPKRKLRLYFLLTLFGMSFFAVLFAVLAIEQSGNLYKTPSEIEQADIGRTLVVGGTVVRGSVQQQTDTLVNFKVRDTEVAQSVEINVYYDGILPDLFEEEQEVILEGVLDPNLHISAVRVYAKHDENYIPASLPADVQIKLKNIESY